MDVISPDIEEPQGWRRAPINRLSPRTTSSSVHSACTPVGVLSFASLIVSIASAHMARPEEWAQRKEQQTLLEDAFRDSFPADFQGYE